jgi:hypothetical protein
MMAQPFIEDTLLKKGRDHRSFASLKDDNEGRVHHCNDHTYISTALRLAFESSSRGTCHKLGR